MEQTKEIEGMKNAALMLLEIATAEGKKFTAENGRIPTEAEAERMVNLIKRQFEIVHKLKGW